MRRSPFLALAAVLIPTLAAAQRTPDLGAIKQAPPLTTRISQHDAVKTALARVRSDLASGQLNTWGGGAGGGILPSAVISAGALFHKTGGRTGVYVVGVTAPNARGHVRVVIDAVTGQVLGTRIGSWDWGAAPEWWRKGENAPPAK